MKTWLLGATTLLLLLSSVTTGAESAPESDEAKFVRLTQALEEQPLSDTARSARTWLIQWASDTKDITVTVCDILDTVSAERSGHDAIYVSQMVFGNAAFQITHPDKRSDFFATQLAAARSSLKAYRSILAAEPTSRIPHFDELVAKDEAGTLESHLRGVVAEKCNN